MGTRRCEHNGETQVKALKRMAQGVLFSPIVGPTVSVPIWWGLTRVLGIYSNESSFSLFFVGAGVVIAGITMLTLGIPVILMLRHFRLVAAKWYAIAGIALTTPWAMFFVSLSNWFWTPQLLAELALFYGTGLIVGLIFWILVVRKNQWKLC
jgi:hypothetical protein